MTNKWPLSDYDRDIFPDEGINLSVHLAISQSSNRNYSAPQHGNVSCSTLDQFGSQCSYDCNYGYKLVGSNTRVCQESGAWTGIQPVCELVQCRPLASPENGFVACSRYVLKNCSEFSSNFFTKIWFWNFFTIFVSNIFQDPSPNPTLNLSF